MRGSARCVRWAIRAIRRPRRETSHARTPCRTTAAGSSAWTTTRSVFGKARSYVTPATDGSDVANRSTWSFWIFSRLTPWSGASTASTRRASFGSTPRTSIVRTAKTEVSRAAANASTATAAAATPITMERPDGRRSSERARKGSRATASRAGDWRVGRLTTRTSPPSPTLLPHGRQLGQLEQLHLVLELHAVQLERTAAGLRHQRDRIVAPCAARVLDEVRVHRRDLRAADPLSPQAARFQHPAGGQVVIWILEDAAERSLVRRLRSFPPRLELADRCLDLVGLARDEPQLHARDDLSVAQGRVSVRQAQLGRRAPVGSGRGHDKSPLEDLREVGAVGAGVHPHSSARRAGYGACELKATEPSLPGAMQHDGVRRAASG